MRRDLGKYLVKKFPLCFGDFGKDPKKSCMYFGIEFGTGWYKILKNACEKAEPLIQKWIDEHKNEKDFNIDWCPKFAQLKEKYATMRIYFTTYPDGFDEIEREAEEKSAKICEQCGKPGKLRGQGWYYTACYKHSKPEDRENLEIVEAAYEKKKKKEKKKNG